jgi:hypothetical protein
MRQKHRSVRRAICQGHHGVGFAGPLVAPPAGEGAEGASGGHH